MRQAGLAVLFKKTFDRSVALVGLIATGPVIAAAAIAVRSTMGGPVFFRQERPGRDGRPFRIFKMRTMTDARDANGQLLPDEMRLTPLGKLLRSTSIDELPQLVNVLTGDLSLVGPRPLLMEYLPLYSPTQARRHEVLPGITGWAQIKGRNSLDWETKFELDVWYVDHWTPLLDLKILASTVLTVARQSGISREGHGTMPKFRGSSVGSVATTPS